MKRSEVGLVIVDHGSKRAESNDMLKQFVAKFAGACNYPIVEPAHMELAEPSIADAFSRCVRRGAKHVVVVPYFLGPGRHWDFDIPALAEGAAEQHDDVTFHVADPIGLHPKMVDVIRDRADAALKRSE